ncbi:phosphatidylserine decarboxylase [Acidisphaera sp. L21]|uniref:phosphatidylserine decarboxylase n=1 Tax=Acidisphaera sp. L21 TaxID=1641851 RepID=UPI00131D9ED3|nr:phosphatidylserine decarboxylase [Acidisphaera sp. L21]
MTLAQTLRTVFAPPHRAGWPFIAGGIIVALIGLVLTRWLFWPGAVFTLFSLYFFRDPERTPPGRADAMVSPADGRVVSVMLAVPPEELGLGPAPRWRIATFLSVLNVHVNRVPATAEVTAIAYRKGAFVNASLDKASDLNERNALAMRLPDGRNFAVVQIAGLIARRILCDAKVGNTVFTGARFGIIRFGSRTDLYLPEGVMPLVVVGQTMVGGETVMANLT